jgi:hypothetical protein
MCNRRYNPFSASSKARRTARGYYGAEGRYLSSVAMNGTVASWRDIVNLGVSDHLVANVSAQEAGGL